AGSDASVPVTSAKPPAATTRPHGKAQLEALGKLALPGFTGAVRELADDVLTVTQRSTARPRVDVTITVTPCMDCLPMQLAPWQAKGEALQLLVLPELRERPDTVFEVGEAPLGGAKAIFTYQLGYSFVSDGAGSGEHAYVDSYALYFNDGKNQLRVIAEYADDPPASKDALVRAMPRARLEQIAGSWLEQYAQRWGN
ncbi:MAG: hypothetical protein H6Q90_144, partial [Deltaproteobacteria bacterium]|nr:hypothetical protein [Deltaproteobacteria bacterium]